MEKAIVIVGLLLFATLVGAKHPTNPAKSGATPESVKAEIEALRSERPAWREIAWRSCLLEGLRESRRTKKPLMLWVFIDRPSDDQRC